jgi:hypothetical protein
MPLDYLQRQVKLLQQWETLELPVPGIASAADPAPSTPLPH